VYKLLTIKDKIRVPPSLFDKKKEESVRNAIKEELIGQLTKNKGVFLELVNIEEIGEGIIIPGDGAIYYETTFKILVYEPEMHEIVHGKVNEIVEFGAFVRISPFDSLVHISQVMDDYVSYSKTGNLLGKESKKSLSVGDKVIARIIAISVKNAENAKIGLTMRQPGLGKIEWIEEERKKAEEERKKIEEAKKEAKKEEKK